VSRVDEGQQIPSRRPSPGVRHRARPSSTTEPARDTSERDTENRAEDEMTDQQRHRALTHRLHRGRRQGWIAE
jgi:hypothetical protein